MELKTNIEDSNKDIRKILLSGLILVFGFPKPSVSKTKNFKFLYLGF